MRAKLFYTDSISLDNTAAFALFILGTIKVHTYLSITNIHPADFLPLYESWR